jgi:VanZ family protein
MIGALVPFTAGLDAVTVPDWLIHGAAYGALTALLYWAVVPSTGARNAAILGALGATVFGAVTEFLQLLQPARTVEARDLLANAVGALTVIGLIGVVRGIPVRRST